MDLRVKKTKKAIQDAFKEMICTMEIQNITVKAISEKAQINRKTFYYHYETIEDLISELMQEILEDYHSKTDQLPKGRSHEVANRLFFEYFSSQEEYVQRIFCHPAYHELCQQLFDASYYHSLDDHHPYRRFSIEKQNIIQTFYRSTTLDIYRQWVSDGKKMPLEELIELSNQLICHGVSDI